MISIEITGLEDMLKSVDPDRLVTVMDQAIDRSVESLRDETKKLPPVSKGSTGYGPEGIPVDSGRMRQAIQKRKTQLLAAEVYAGTTYSGYVHDGTGKMPPRPFFLWELLDFGGKAKIEAIVKQYLLRLFP